MNIQIGNILKNARKESKMTLNELADKTGISTGYLSLMERGLNSPTIENLNKVCLALNLTLSDLIAQAENSATTVVTPDKRIRLFEEQGYVYESAFDGTRNMNCIFVTLKDEQEHTADKHINDEMGYVVKGDMQVDVDGVEYDVKQGDCIYIEANSKHSIRKTGDGECVSVWFNMSGGNRK